MAGLNHQACGVLASTARCPDRALLSKYSNQNEKPDLELSKRSPVMQGIGGLYWLQGVYPPDLQDAAVQNVLQQAEASLAE
jgi:hypothetical protein